MNDQTSALLSLFLPETHGAPLPDTPEQSEEVDNDSDNDGDNDNGGDDSDDDGSSSDNGKMAVVLPSRAKSTKLNYHFSRSVW